MNRESLEVARDTWLHQPARQFNRLNRMMDLRRQHASCPNGSGCSRCCVNPGNNLGGYKMGINGNTVALTKTIYGELLRHDGIDD